MLDAVRSAEVLRCATGCDSFGVFWLLEAVCSFVETDVDEAVNWLDAGGAISERFWEAIEVGNIELLSKDAFEDNHVLRNGSRPRISGDNSFTNREAGREVLEVVSLCVTRDGVPCVRAEGSCAAL